jgi:hypothetical protein
MSVWQWWKYWWGKIEVYAEKLAPLTLFPSQIPRGLVWDLPGPLQ